MNVCIKANELDLGQVTLAAVCCFVPACVRQPRLLRTVPFPQ